MDTHSLPYRRRTAKVLAALFWAVGTAYLIDVELRTAAPNWVVVAATPLVWAGVVALPVLAHWALIDRQRLAALLLSLAALIGSAYTLSGTIGRQAESRDVSVAAAARIDEQRQAIGRDIADAKAMLAAAQRQCGTGKTCASATQYLIGLTKLDVDRHEARLAALKPVAPDAGEKRIAAFVGLFVARSEADLRAAVGLVLPALLGLLLELAALACALYGWSQPSGRDRPASSDTTGQSDYPALSALEAKAMASIVRPSDDQGGGGVMPDGPTRPDRPSGRRSEVIAQLIRDLEAGRTYGSQREVAERFGVARSTLSDWLREAEADGVELIRRPTGRCKQLEKA